MPAPEDEARFRSFPQARHRRFFCSKKSRRKTINEETVHFRIRHRGTSDKVCDQIADAVLDAILAKDPDAHVACECCATTGMVLVMGEITTSAYVPIDQIARNKIVEIGYDRAKYGFDGQSCAVLVSVDEQSPDIAMGVKRGDENMGAGRPGHDVRLCLRRDARIHAAGHLPGAQTDARPRAGAQVRRHPLPAAGRQGAGDRGIRRRPPGARRGRGHLHAARPRGHPRADRARHD